LPVDSVALPKAATSLTSARAVEPGRPAFLRPHQLALPAVQHGALDTPSTSSRRGASAQSAPRKKSDSRDEGLGAVDRVHQPEIFRLVVLGPSSSP